MEEGSSALGNFGNNEQPQAFKDKNLPDGDACRPDGTLKDASEMSWPNSPSEAQRNLPELSEDGYNLKRSLPSSDEEESCSKSNEHPKVKVNYISIAFTDLENLLYGVQQKLSKGKGRAGKQVPSRKGKETALGNKRARIDNDIDVEDNDIEVEDNEIEVEAGSNDNESGRETEGEKAEVCLFSYLNLRC